MMLQFKKRFIFILAGILVLQEIFFINAGNKVKIFAEQSITIVKYYGDINKDGIVNALDEQMLIKIVNGISSVTDDIKERCDLNGDGNITKQDIELIQKYNEHSIDYFPVEPVFYGDIDLNGQITVSDLSAIINAVTYPFSDTDKKVRADLNGDGNIDKEDSNLLSSYLSGKIKYFPVQNMLKYIQIKTKPTKLQYNIRENIDTAGMTIEAYYNNGYHRTVTNWTVYGNTNIAGNAQITVSYSEGTVSKTVSYAINVQDIILKEIKIDVEPNKLYYTIGEAIDTTGMVVKAYYTDGTYKEVLDVDISGDTNKAGENKITVSYKEKGITKTANYTIKVQNNDLNVDDPDSKLDDDFSANIPDDSVDVEPGDFNTDTKPDFSSDEELPNNKENGMEDTDDKTESDDSNLNTDVLDTEELPSDIENLPDDIERWFDDIQSEESEPGLENSDDIGVNPDDFFDIPNDENETQILEEKKESTIHIKTSSYKKAYGSKAFYLNASTDGDGELQYVSQDKNVVLADSDGKVLINGYGKTTITITALGTNNYKKAEKTITVEIVPKKTKFKIVKPKKNGKLSLSWKNIKRGLWYEINMSTDKKFKKDNIQRSTKKTKITVNSLKKHQFYYIRVRVYKIIDHKSYYSKWSSVKKVRMK